MRVTVREKLFVVYQELVPMESGADNLSDQDTATVTKELEEPATNQKMNLWWKEENWPSLKKDMERGRNPVVNGVCEADFLELVEDPVPRKTVTNFCKGLTASRSHMRMPSPPRN